jgi:hypothetical protein
MTIEITKGSVTEKVYIYQDAPTYATADNNIITADNTLITADNG